MNPFNFKQFLFAGMIAGFAAAMLSACGNVDKNGSDDISVGYLANGGAHSEVGGATDGCPTDANILPQHDWFHDGTGRYRACAGVSVQQVIVKGLPNNQNSRICVFPAEMNNHGQSIFTKADPASGALQLPMVDCKTPSASNGATFAFNANFNYIFVVEERFKDQMQACLKNGNFWACPIQYPNSYAYGTLPWYNPSL